MGVADPATLSAFRLDKYLVTVGRFRQFVDAWSGGAGYHPAVGSGKHTHLNGGQGLADVATPGSFEQGWPLAGNGWIQPTVTSLMQCGAAQSWTPAPGPNESLPVNCMNWYEAYAFCIWDGGFLPSEAEWELVAAGGDEQREYAWGAADPGTTNQYAIYAYSAPTGGTSCYYPDGSACSGLVNIAPVGTALLGVSKWGQLDMAGELGEWVMDGFAPYVDPCTDCANLSDSSFRVIRGGAYDFVEKLLAPTTRNGRYPPGRNGDVGFRCARAP
jgi:formylglycine-generating enzyme required for sulfatase activity